MARKKQPVRKIDPNLIVAFGLLVVSFSTLFVYLKQARIMSEQTKILLEQTKANAWPHLSIELFRKYNKKGLSTFSIEIVNKGTGPALLENTVISYDGISLSNWGEFYQAIQIPDSIPVAHNNSNINDRVLASNEKLLLINWSVEDAQFDNSRALPYIGTKADKLTIEICYKSIHGDYWKVKRSGFHSDLESNERSTVSACDPQHEKSFLE